MKAGVLSFFISFVSVCWLACVLCSFKSLLYAFGSFLLFALPGWALGLALFGRQGYRCPEWLICGSALGIGLSGSVAVAVGYLIGWSPGLVIAGLLILTGVCAMVAWFSWDHPLLPAPRNWEKWEYALLTAIIVVVVVFVAIPFFNIGKLTDNGYAYTWLFGYDFLVRGEYTLAMTRGFPPSVLPLAGELLKMYLVGYSLPAFIYTVSAKAVSLHMALLLSSLGLNCLLYSGLFVFVRIFHYSKRVLFSTFFVFLFGYSFYWAVSLAKSIVSTPGSLPYLQRLSEHLQLFRYGNVSHLLTPLVLVEPQAVQATCLVLFLLFVLELKRYNLGSFRLSFLLGVTLGVTFGTDALWGLTAMLWFGAVQLGKLLAEQNQRANRFGMLCTVIASCVLTCGAFFLLGMYPTSSHRQIYFEPYSWLFKFGALYFPIEFGPLLILGVWGFLLVLKRSRRAFLAPLIALALVAVIEVGVLRFSVLPKTRMAVRVLPLVLIVGVGHLFRELYEGRGERRQIYVAWAIALMAVPTFFSDIHFTSNIHDVNETRYVSASDLKACDWIRRILPEGIVIQGEPQYLGYVGGYNPREELFISLIADFAERPQALGWGYVASELVPNGERVVTTRMRDIESMLSARDTNAIIEVARKYSIAYIYVGPYEESLHPILLKTLASAPEAFDRVYSTEGVYIFRVRYEMK